MEGWHHFHTAVMSADFVRSGEWMHERKDGISNSLASLERDDTAVDIHFASAPRGGIYSRTKLSAVSVPKLSSPRVINSSCAQGFWVGDEEVHEIR